MLQLEFQSTVIEWRGPAPFFFAPIPLEHAGDIRRAAKFASYGWGVIPVAAEISGVAFTTSLFPRDETYLLPIKAAVRRKCNVTVDDMIEVAMTIRPAGR
jgi:Domain of unknown function (DUF1905)